MAPFTEADVLALALGGAPALTDALARQTAVPGRVEHAADLRDAVARGASSGCEWLWLLDGSALPAPDALERLLGARAGVAGAPAPAVLASRVVDGGGAAAAGLAPWYRRGPTDLAMRAVLAGMLPIRAARAGSLLVARAAAAGAAPRPGLSPSAAALEWTARLLRARQGFLVTASVATAAEPPASVAEALDPDPREDVRGGLAMLLGGALHPKERLWLGAEVAGRTVRAVTSGAGRRAARGRS